MPSTINADNGVSSGSAGLKSAADSSGVLQLQTNGTTAVTVDTSQNVGVGTSSPGVKLDVVGVSGQTLRLRNGSTATEYYDIGRDGADGLLAFNGAQTTFVGYKWSTTGTERMRIDSSGNVGIGTSSPSYKLDVRGGSAAIINSSGNATVFVGEGLGVNQYGYIRWDKTNTTFNVRSQANPIVFGTDTTDWARFDTSGNLLVGSTSAISGFTQVSVTGSSTNRGALIMGRATAATTGVAGTLIAYNGSNPVCGFDFQSNGANNSGYIGTYTYNAGTFSQGPYLNTGGTSWTTASDESLKDIIEPISGGVDKLSDLRTVIGKYKTDPEGTRRVFMIAQDVQKILPEAINKDSNGYLGLNYQDLIPVLVKAVQELNAKVQALESQLAAKG